MASAELLSYQDFLEWNQCFIIFCFKNAIPPLLTAGYSIFTIFSFYRVFVFSRSITKQKTKIFITNIN